MDIQSAQQENSIPLSISLIKKTLPVITLLFGFFLGLLVWPILPFGNLSVPPPPPETNVALPSPSAKPTIDESKLPISWSLLTNPIVYEWRGGVKGKLISKNEHDFTLVDEQGNSITITDKMPSGNVFKPMFFDKSNISKQISLTDIPLGSILLGDFFIFKGSPNTLVGSSFIKQ
ncbi:MAG: hypothetical protein Q8P89_00660 [bacterium]|nr:hypothetical protein [bacterium]